MSTETCLGSLNLREIQIAHRETGPAGDRPVVALHGMISSGRTWDRFAIKCAEQGRRLIAIDLRGHGGSSRPGPYALTELRDDLAGALDLLDLDRPDVVGHSLGGYVATLLAMHSPARIGRGWSWRIHRHRHTADTSIPATRRLIQSLGAVVLLTRLRQFDLRMARPVLAQLRQPDAAWWDAVTGIDTPALILGRGPASHLPVEKIRAMAARIPDSRLVTIADAGHRIHSTRPDEFAHAVLDFLRD